MKKKHFFLALGLTAALAGTVQAGQRPLSFCVNGTEGSLLNSRGQLLQQLEFENGQALAGPLPPGQYRIRTDRGTVVFTLCTNASLCRVDGPGWTDGEQLHLGAGCGSLSVLYEGEWSCTLSGETAAKAIPSLSDGQCHFEELPFGWYVLETPAGNLPLLLTPDQPQVSIDLR